MNILIDETSFQENVNLTERSPIYKSKVFCNVEMESLEYEKLVCRPYLCEENIFTLLEYFAHEM